MHKGMKGGSWVYWHTLTRTATRSWNTPAYTWDGLGFRIVRRERKWSPK